MAARALAPATGRPKGTAPGREPPSRGQPRGRSPRSPAAGASGSRRVPEEPNQHSRYSSRYSPGPAAAASPAQRPAHLAAKLPAGRFNAGPVGKASGSTDRWLGPDAVRHMSVTIAMQPPTAKHRGTQRDKEKTARRAAFAQPAARFRWWWQVMDSNHRRRSRRFHSRPRRGWSHSRENLLCQVSAPCGRDSLGQTAVRQTCAQTPRARDR